MSNEPAQLGVISVAGPSSCHRENEKQSDKLLSLCTGLCLHHDADNVAHVTFEYGGARQTHRVRSTAFRSLLCFRAHNELGLTPSSNAIQEALNIVEGRAIFEGPSVKYFRRMASHAGKLYLDLCNESWQAIEIDTSGWRIVSAPPVHFTRGTGALALPDPVAGDIRTLREFLNVETDDDFDILVAFLIAALQPAGPFPVLALNGRQGSCKSTAARLLAKLLDPNRAPLRSTPKSEDDMLVAAQHSWLICFDNVSSLSPALSDALCRLSTGGGTAKRKLYTDDEAVILDVCRPVILTGIGTYITRGDLADRVLPVSLRPLHDSQYRPETELMAAFEAERPAILGGLLSALSCSIRRRGAVRGSSRMADFEAVVESAGPELGWEAGHFNRLLARTRDSARRDLISDDELAQALLSVGDYHGSMADLREKLLEGHERPPAWLPKNPRALGSAIDRLAPMLENVGLTVTRPPRSGGKKSVILQWESSRDGQDGVNGHPQPNQAAREECPSTKHLAEGHCNGHACNQLHELATGERALCDLPRESEFNADDLDRLADLEGKPSSQERGGSTDPFDRSG